MYQVKYRYCTVEQCKIFLFWTGFILQEHRHSFMQKVHSLWILFREPVLPPPDFDPDSLELGVGISIEDLLEQQKQRPPERPRVAGAFAATPVPPPPPSVTAEQKLAAFNDEVNEILRPFKEDVDKSWQRFKSDIEAGATPPPPPLPPPSQPPPPTQQKFSLLTKNDEKERERSRRAKFAALDKINNLVIEDGNIINNEVEQFTLARKPVKPDHKDQSVVNGGFSVPINRRPTVARTRPAPSQPEESPSFSSRVRLGSPKPNEISNLPSLFEPSPPPPQPYPPPQISITARPSQFFTTSFPAYSSAGTPGGSYFSTTGGYSPVASAPVESTTPGERGRVRYQAGHTPRQRSTTTTTPFTTVSPISLATTTITATTEVVRPAVSELRYPAVRTARYENIR